MVERYRPGGQAFRPWPFGQKYPAGQGVVSVFPVSGQYVPSGQGLQSAIPGGEGLGAAVCNTWGQGVRGCSL